MTNENQISTLVTASIVISGLVVAWYFISSIFFKEEEVACGASASNIYQMNVKSSTGQLLTPIGLQSELGMNALGILENTRVVNTGISTPPVAIEISLPEGSSSPYQSSQKTGGIDFKWQPRDLVSANTACVRFALKFNDDFKPGKGGVLPGIFAGNIHLEEDSDGNNGFAIHALWNTKGQIELHAQIPNNRISNPAILKRKQFDIAKGRWVWIDQQITLNTPDENDGTFKLWIDGKLAYENARIAWRKDASLALKGVSGSVYYGGPKKVSTAPESTTIGLSPFQLSWK